MNIWKTFIHTHSSDKSDSTCGGVPTGLAPPSEKLPKNSVLSVASVPSHTILLYICSSTEQGMVWTNSRHNSTSFIRGCGLAGYFRTKSKADLHGRIRVQQFAVARFSNRWGNSLTTRQPHIALYDWSSQIWRFFEEITPASSWPNEMSLPGNKKSGIIVRQNSKIFRAFAALTVTWVRDKETDCHPFRRYIIALQVSFYFTCV